MYDHEIAPMNSTSALRGQAGFTEEERTDSQQFFGVAVHL